jgi:ATP-dependent helicase/nuclease subunit B
MTLPELTQRDEESDEDFARRREGQRAIAEGLVTLLRSLLDCASTLGADASGLSSATLAWLRLLPAIDEAEAQTLERLRARLGELAKIPSRPASTRDALPAFRESLSEFRAWPMLTADHKPWAASGGMVHLTDIRHAGLTGRPRIFVVGLDAGRASSAGRSDPLLTDAIRERIGVDRLPTLEMRRAERAWTLASALAALRGRVTLSYATGSGADRPQSSPSPVLLQAFRLVRDDVSLSYRDLRDALNPPASPVPLFSEARGNACVDARDVWLGTIAKGDLLLDAQRLTRKCFAGLDAGLRARDAAQSPKANEYHGIIAAAGPAFDPLRAGAREMSPSELERLASCPMSWFYKYGLRIRPPNDPEYDPNCWLDAPNRGSLLHDVFERFVSAYCGRQDEIHGDGARDQILRFVDEAIGEYRTSVPLPGETVVALESNELRSAALAFLNMERALAKDDDRAEWLDVEFSFGEERPATFTLASGLALRVRGRADRIDRLSDQSLRVIDYKTGSTWAYKNRSSKTGPFRGGRHLQPSVYAGVVQSLLGAPVSTFEYRFPTAKGSGHVADYKASELSVGAVIVGDYVGMIRAGQFIPTDDSADCKYCDARDVCRVSTDDDGWVQTSPRADWAKQHGESLEVYQIMRRHRAPR